MKKAKTVFLLTDSGEDTGVTGFVNEFGEVSVKLAQNRTPFFAPSTAAQVGHLASEVGPTLESRPTWNFSGRGWVLEDGTSVLDL